MFWVQTDVVIFVAGMVWVHTCGFGLPHDVSSLEVTFGIKSAIFFNVILLETLKVNSQEIFHIHWILSITAVFSRARHWFLSWTRKMQFTPSHSASLTSDLILSLEAIHVIWKYISKNIKFPYSEIITNFKPTANSLVLITVGVIGDYVVGHSATSFNWWRKGWCKEGLLLLSVDPWHEVSRM